MVVVTVGDREVINVRRRHAKLSQLLLKRLFLRHRFRGALFRRRSSKRGRYACIPDQVASLMADQIAGIDKVPRLAIIGMLVRKHRRVLDVEPPAINREQLHGGDFLGQLRHDSRLHARVLLARSKREHRETDHQMLHRRFSSRIRAQCQRAPLPGQGDPRSHSIAALNNAAQFHPDIIDR